MAKILITGASGFIAGHLIELLKDKHEIFTIDKKDSILVLDYNENLSNYMTLSDFFNKLKPDIVIHLASNISNDYQKCIEDIQSITNLLDLSLQNKVQKFIFTSSAAVYGDSYPKTVPINGYGISKLQCEQWCAYYEELGLNMNILRLGNVYGKNGKGVINRFIKNIENNEPLSIRGDGHQIRDFVHINDVCGIIEKCLYYKHSGTFKVGTGHGYEIWDIVSKLNSVPLTIINEPLEKYEIRKSVLRDDDLMLFLDYRNFISLEEGIKSLWTTKTI